jgi:hypothetical protein
MRHECHLWKFRYQNKAPPEDKKKHQEKIDEEKSHEYEEWYDSMDEEW